MNNIHPKIQRKLHPCLRQHIKDFIFAPLRFMLSESPVVRQLGLSTLSDIRYRAAAPYCVGRVLDVTCGSNALKDWVDTRVVGADLSFRSEIDVCADAHTIPFNDEAFATVVLLASLNYMHDPTRVLGEAYRVLQLPGRVIVSMISPFMGQLRVNLQNPFLGIKKNWADTNKALGMHSTQVKALLADVGFREFEHHKFLYGLNNLIIGYKR